MHPPVLDRICAPSTGAGSGGTTIVVVEQAAVNTVSEPSAAKQADFSGMLVMGTLVPAR
jgi:galactokinase